MTRPLSPVCLYPVIFNIRSVDYHKTISMKGARMKNRLISAVSLVFILLVASGCSSMPKVCENQFTASLFGCGELSNGRKWGQDATFLPGWERVGKAAKDAATDPKFLLPMAGSLLMQVSDYDKKLSDWAQKHTPIYGSPENAADWSDDLEKVLTRWVFITMIPTPSGDTPKEWMISKAKGLAVEVAAIETTTRTTHLIKDIRGRNRPNEANRQSFPSGHTSKAFCRASLAMENIEAMNISRPAKLALHHGTLATATFIAWGRIEGGWHYPGDVLAGAALGTFFANFMHDAFMGPDEDEIGLFCSPDARGGYYALVSFSF